MKSKSFFLYLFCCSLLAFTSFSCKKKTPAPTPVVPVEEPVIPPITKVFNCKIDGTTFTGTTIGGVLNTGYIMVSGKTNNTIVQVWMPADKDPGTYPIVKELTQYIENGAIFGCQSGSVTITSHDKAKKEIVGTFTYTAKNEAGALRQIANGNFATSY